MPDDQAERTFNLRIRQVNLNGSPIARNDLINSDIHDKYDLILIQEPPINTLGKVSASSKWRIVYPSSHLSLEEKIRAVILVNANLSTNAWHQVDINDSNDLVAIQLEGPFGTATIVNIYNDITHSRTLIRADIALANIRTNVLALPQPHDHYIVWAGDFNRHHPRWDEERNRQLFTAQNMDDAQLLIDILDEHLLEMALPKDIPTLEFMRTKNWTRPDNVFCSANAIDVLVRCTTVPGERGSGTDHVPIDTVLDLPVTRTIPPVSFNFQAADWDKFQNTLIENLPAHPPPARIQSEDEFHEKVTTLSAAILDTIEQVVPKSNPAPHSKRWWSKDLGLLRKVKNKLNVTSYRFRHDRQHPSHDQLREARNKLTDAIRDAKQRHWENFLEETGDETLWTAARYIDSPYAGEGGAKTRVPILHTKDQLGVDCTARSNEDKARVIAESFFPPPPATTSVPPDFRYPKPVAYRAKFTKEQILRMIRKLSPYKTPGPDGIPNIVFKQCADILVDHLYHIYNASLQDGYYFPAWLESLTAVIRKPGRQAYDVPKSYRPIALLNTIAKIFTALVAEDITTLAEQHKLLPACHFGGRPGLRTTDSMHLLTHRIKQAWRNGRVASILFLDIEGAFPNAVKDRLLHNMRKRRVPDKLVNIVDVALTGRLTRLRFDDYISGDIPLQNGIGQGDPMSMIIYLFYNADILDIPRTKNELVVAFVDDTALFVEGPSFDDTHSTLRRMMNRRNGAFEWSAEHNSKFEISKFALIDFSRKKDIDRPSLRIRQTTIPSAVSHKFLGVIFDQELRWKLHVDYAVAKATKWVSLFKRIARNRSGLSAPLLRRLYKAVAIPKAAYAADVWFTPIQSPPGAKRRTGSVWAANRLTRVQRQAAIAITGCFRTTATDYVEAHANLMPVELLLKDLCLRAMTRMISLNDGHHPLMKVVRHSLKRPVKRHPSPSTPLQSSQASTLEMLPHHHSPPSRSSKGPFSTA